MGFSGEAESERRGAAVKRIFPMKNILLATLALVASGFAQAPTPVPKPKPPPPPGVTEVLDLPYVTGGHERQRLDLYLPAKEGVRPLIVWMHGGAWWGGSKDLDYAYCRRMAEQGYVVASLGYRLSRTAAWPAQLEDCKSAIRWLRANAAKYRFDPQRVGAMGFSAGGHLVQMLGVTGDGRDFDAGEHLDQSSAVQAVVSLNFIPTFPTSTAVSANDKTAPNWYDQPYSVIFGGELRDHLDEARSATPTTYANKGDAPMLLKFGTKDPVIPAAAQPAYQKAFEDGGVIVQSVATSLGHTPSGTPESDAARDAFLAKHLQP